MSVPSSTSKSQIVTSFSITDGRESFAQSFSDIKDAIYQVTNQHGHWSNMITILTTLIIHTFNHYHKQDLNKSIIASVRQLENQEFEVEVKDERERSKMSHSNTDSESSSETSESPQLNFEEEFPFPVKVLHTPSSTIVTYSLLQC